VSVMPPAIEGWEVLDLLSSLVQKSLVVYEEDEQGGGRYRLLETVRQYARDRLLEASEGEAVRDRHGQFCLGLAEAAHADAEKGRGAEAFERLEPEHDNLLAALEWGHGCEAGRTLRLAGVLGEFWFERGYWNEGRHWLEFALASTPGVEPTAERARALIAAGRIAAAQADNPAARSRLEESVALCRLLGNTRGLIASLSYLHQALRNRDPAAARMTSEKAVALARNLGDPRLLSMALSELAITLFDFYAEFETACLLQEESLALARHAGDRALMAQSLERLGRFSQAQGDWARASELLEESLELARTANNKHRVVWALYSLAKVHSRQGDPERAKSLWEECLLLARELRMPGTIAATINWLVGHGLPYEEGVQMAEQAAAEYGSQMVPLLINLLMANAPSYEEALQRIDQAARDCGPRAVIHALGGLGHAARERGDFEWAATCYRRSLALRQEVGDTLAIAQSLEDMAVLAARQEQWERAARLLGAAEGVCVEMGWPLPVAAPVEGARAALGEEAFAAAWAEGRAMTVAQAISDALERETRPNAFN
jgi:tetratricopeptide (TPR) repeat protein